MSDSKNDYYSKVYQIVAEIPEGKVTTYGAIAGRIGIKSGARMVGYALNNLIHNTEENLPAHRVVNRLGQLTGRIHFPGNTMKERLLQENVTFTDEDTVDIENHFWKP
jgi:methylated-DNA-protein-cysteine methyltransferase-like protein